MKNKKFIIFFIMELSKYITKSKNLLDKSVEKDLDKIASLLSIEYNITDEYNCVVSKNDIFNKISLLFKSDIAIKICCGITSKNTRCTRSPLHNYNFCKTHINQQIEKKTYNTQTHNIQIPKISFDNNTSILITDLSKKLINNKYYYVDNKFIYDINNKIKIGYISNNQYIFTDDPVILENI